MAWVLLCDNELRRESEKRARIKSHQTVKSLLELSLSLSQLLLRNKINVPVFLPEGPCTYDVRTEGGGGVQELPNFADG